MLSSLGITTSLSQINLLGPLCVLKYKMNGIIKKFLLAGERFMTEMLIEQPGFTYSACGPFTKNRQRIQKIKETGDSRYVYQNKLGKVCFNMAYGDLKDLTASDKRLRDKAFNIAKNPKYDGYQRDLSWMVHNFFDNNTSALRTNKFARSGIKNENISNKELAEELQKPVKWSGESVLVFYRQY